MPTDAKPHPATSLYLKTPRAISPKPTKIIIKVAQAKTVFLFIPIVLFLGKILINKASHKYRLFIGIWVAGNFYNSHFKLVLQYLPL